MKLSATLLLFFVAFFGYSQKNIYIKVEYFSVKDPAHPYRNFSPDSVISSLNGKPTSVEIQNNGISTKTIVIPMQFTLVENINTQPLSITVNPESKLYKSKFQANNSNNDSIVIKISDEKVMRYYDSINDLEAYSFYSEEQAYNDFKNGKKRLFIRNSYPSRTKSNRLKKITEKFGIEFVNAIQCIESETKIRSIARYNNKMKELIGMEVEALD